MECSTAAWPWCPSAGLGAILTYHVVSGNLFDQPQQRPAAASAP